VKTGVSIETGAAANPFLQQAAVRFFESNGHRFLGDFRFHEDFKVIERLSCYPIVKSSVEMASIAYFAPRYEGRINKDSTEEEWWWENCLCGYATGHANEVIAVVMAQYVAEFGLPLPRAQIIETLNRESAAYRRRPGRPLKGGSLRTVLLDLWLPAFLWTMSNQHKVWLLEEVANYSFGGYYGDKAEAVKIMVRRIGLIGWSAFTAGGVPRASGQLTRDSDGRLHLTIDLAWLEQHSGCQKAKFPPGHNSIMSPLQECDRSA
jgi:hypothetical protein